MGDRTGAGQIVVMFGNEATPATCDDMPVQITGAHSGAGISDPMDAGDLDGDGKSDLVASYYLSYYHNWQTYCMTLWYGRDSGILTSTEADADFDSATGRDWPHPCGLNKENLFPWRLKRKWG